MNFLKKYKGLLMWLTLLLSILINSIVFIISTTKQCEHEYVLYKEYEYNSIHGPVFGKVYECKKCHKFKNCRSNRW